MATTLPTTFLSSARGKFESDLQKSRGKQWMTPVKAAIRQLNINEEEKARFVIDIKKYAENEVNPEDLIHIPPDKILPYLLNCFWRAQVKSTKSESEYTDGTRSKEEEDKELDDSDAYETMEENEEEEEEEEEESEVKEKKMMMTSIDPVDTNLVESDNSRPTLKYKLLLDNVAPFYLEKKSNIMLTGHSSSDIQVGGPNPLDTISQSPEKRRFSRSLWRYAIDNMKPEYRLPTLILKKYKYVKREEPRNLGPGTYDTHDYECQRKAKLRQMRGQMYSCTPRFGKEYVKTDCPDPGAYGNPYERYWKMVDRLKHPCRKPIMQSGPCNVRGSSFKTVGSALGPGDYNIKSTSIVDKKVSLRGPYDLFTGGRFDYMKPKNASFAGQYGIYDTMKQNLCNRCNNMKGRWSKLNRDQKYTGERITVVNPMWPTAESEEKPGPGAYDIHETDYHRTCWGENYWAFNISSKREPRVDLDYDHAPTRYRPGLDLKYCPIGCGFRSNFKSKTQRLDPPKQAVLGERLRAKDIPPQEKYLKEKDNCPL